MAALLLCLDLMLGFEDIFESPHLVSQLFNLLDLASDSALFESTVTVLEMFLNFFKLFPKLVKFPGSKCTGRREWVKSGNRNSLAGGWRLGRGDCRWRDLMLFSIGSICFLVILQQPGIQFTLKTADLGLLVRDLRLQILHISMVLCGF